MVPATSSKQWEAILGPYDLWLRRRVRSTMRRKGLRPWREEVLDYVQEVYCKLLQGGPRRLGRLRRLHKATLLVYLGRVADGVVVDQIRAASTIKRGGDAQHPARKCWVPKVDLEDPERILLRAERHRLLIRRLLEAAESRRIPESSVRMLWLASVEGWRSRDIARAFRIQPRSVDSMLCRLRRRFAREGFELRRRTRRRRTRRYDAARCASSPTPAAFATAPPAAIQSARSASRAS
jgi:DNA-directed RNA polymerase specialized sigma24 family protein